MSGTGNGLIMAGLVLISFQLAAIVRLLSQIVNELRSRR